MDGTTLLRKLRQRLNEDDASAFMDDLFSYELLHEGAVELVSRTNCLRGEHTITTVADQYQYDLPADFMRIMPVISGDQEYEKVKYNDGTSDTWLEIEDFSELIYARSTTSVDIPASFAITDNPTLPSRISGTATSAGAASGGESVLTDSGAAFVTGSVSTGDYIHNTTDGSTGVVLEVTSGTALKTALFNGTTNDWSTSDGYVIQPQGRLQLVLDPPPDDAGDTITVYYVKRPEPVFSDYGTYRFPPHYSEAVVYYAAWLYKYRDREPNFGDAWYRWFESTIRQSGENSRRARSRKRIVFNLKPGRK